MPLLLAVAPIGWGLPAFAPSTWPLAWIDGVTICATFVTPGEKFDTFAMIETDFLGKRLQETTILEVPVNKKLQKQAGRYLVQLPL